MQCTRSLHTCDGVPNGLGKSERVPNGLGKSERMPNGLGKSEGLWEACLAARRQISLKHHVFDPCGEESVPAMCTKHSPHPLYVAKRPAVSGRSKVLQPSAPLSGCTCQTTSARVRQS